jgi:tetratricopeptide (TPR) repeat protein
MSAQPRPVATNAEPITAFTSLPDSTTPETPAAVPAREDAPDGMITIQQGMMAVQEGAMKIQEAISAESDLNVKMAATALQLGAVEVLKGGLAIQMGAANTGVVAAADNDTNPVFHNSAGAVHLAEGRLTDALASFKKAIELQPDYLEARKNLADTLLNLTSFAEAAATYREIIKVNPEFSGVHNNLGIALLGQYSYEEARDVFHTLLEREHGLPLEQQARFLPREHPGNTSEPMHASPFKLTAIREQLSYLIEKRLIDDSFQGLLERYEDLAVELSQEENRVPYTPLTSNQVEKFGGYFDKVIHYADAPRLAGPTMNDSLDYEAIEEEYFDTRALYFDDFLSPEALHGLRKFFLESTVFFRQSEAGFVGSYITDGFDCSLVFQLIEELRQRFPRVLKDRPLNNMWCYRYGCKGSGVRPHNGDGSVTINFWLTPDEANVEAASGGGGMVMYDKEHPSDWDWLQFNMYKDDPAIQARISEYLVDAKATTIPYRCNRAVLFHSTLFHKTDPFHFRDGHENRRMNITMLFGRRGQESAPLK